MIMTGTGCWSHVWHDRGAVRVSLYLSWNDGLVHRGIDNLASGRSDGLISLACSTVVLGSTSYVFVDEVVTCLACLARVLP